MPISEFNYRLSLDLNPKTATYLIIRRIGGSSSDQDISSCLSQSYIRLLQCRWANVQRFNFDYLGESADIYLLIYKETFCKTFAVVIENNEIYPNHSMHTTLRER